MSTTTLELKSLEIPFKVSFRHASAVRDETLAFLVLARADGLTGYGEGCPRAYVTGETGQSVIAFFERHRDNIEANVTDLSALQDWGARYEEEIDQNPAAWCAIELALLDLFARKQKCSVEALLGLPPLSGAFVYTAVLGAMDAESFAATLRLYRTAGLRDYKIKLSGDLAQDRSNVGVLKKMGIFPAHVRADANNLWSDEEAARKHLAALDFPFAALEEPLLAGRFAQMANLADALKTRIVLDESITRETQLVSLVPPADRWIVNIRVSKMGGLLRSLAVADGCRARGLGVVVGAQVGETSLLTRAALPIAQALRGMLIGQEGAYGTHLLKEDVFEPCLMFGRDGVLDLSAYPSVEGPGFGLCPVAKR